MENQEQKKLIGPVGIVFDLILTVVFYFYMASVLVNHVHLEVDNKVLMGAFAALPLAGGFWLAINMLRVTWVDHKRNPRN